MPDTFLGRIKKTLAAPKPSAHHLAYRSVIPLHTRIWQSIRPPAKVPSTAPPMSRGQRRLLMSVVAVASPILIGWGIYAYVSSAPDRSVSRLQEGIALAAAGQVDQAIGKFSDAIATWPDNSKAYFERGNAYVLSSRAEKAKEDWNKALELDPKLAEAYVARGTEYRIEGNNEKALADLDRAITLHATGDAYYQRGQLFATADDNTKAIEAYTLAIGLLPSAPYIYLSRAAARKATGDDEGSELDRDAAVKLGAKR